MFASMVLCKHHDSRSQTGVASVDSQRLSPGILPVIVDNRAADLNKKLQTSSLTLILPKPMRTVTKSPGLGGH